MAEESDVSDVDSSPHFVQGRISADTPPHKLCPISSLPHPSAPTPARGGLQRFVINT